MASSIKTKSTKRQKIAISSLVYAAAVLLILFGGIGWWGMLIMVALAYCVVIISLDMDLRLEEWLVYPLLPILATISFYTWMSQYADSQVALLIAASTAIGIGMYGLLLTLNILNISTVRVLPLARTAKTVLSMVGIVIAFSTYQLIAVGQPQHLHWILSVGGVSLLISWPLIWTSMTGKKQLLRSVGWAGLASLVQMQLATITGWWPISYMTSLFLSMSLFISLGLFHLQEQKKTSGAEKKQYLFLAVMLAIGYYLTSSW